MRGPRTFQEQTFERFFGRCYACHLQHASDPGSGAGPGVEARGLSSTLSVTPILRRELVFEHVAGARATTSRFSGRAAWVLGDPDRMVFVTIPSIPVPSFSLQPAQLLSA